MTGRNNNGLFLVIFIFTAVCAAWALGLGGSGFKLAGFSASERFIFLNIRLPRVILGLFVGAGLAVSGAVLQAVLRNPLADPYITGTSSGAAFGAVFLVFMGMGSMSPLGAFIAGTFTVFAVYLMAGSSGKRSDQTIILAGVAVSAFMSAFTLFFMVLSRKSAYTVLFYLIGNLQNTQEGLIISIAVLVVTGISVSWFFSRDLNIISMGSHEAHYLGVDPDILVRIILVVSSLTVAGCVAVSGIIGFVGLIVPHAVRLMLGADHRRLIPASALAGAGFLVACDALARTVLYPLELPVGIITAFLGVPFFLYLLRRNT